MAEYPIIVTGAGPVGLLVALRLARGSIPVTILEALPAIEASPRAMVYQPVAVRELERAGVLDDLRKISSQGRKICWRKTHSGEIIAELERNVTPDYPYENLVIGQHDLARVILDHLGQYECAKILYGRRVLAVDQSLGDFVHVSTEGPDGSKETFKASYLVGADGGRSWIRRICEIGFVGFTWPQQLVATNVYYPFDKHGFCEGNFMIDKDHWALIAKINESGLWRVAYGELENATHEQLRDRLPMKFDAIFPGPRPLEYTVDMFSPYRIHQRCAETFCKGRVLLAGDAAHCMYSLGDHRETLVGGWMSADLPIVVCNPYGGLGLTGGLLDAAALADVLIAIMQRKLPATDAKKLLQKYGEVRRDVFLNIVNPMSQANMRRVCESDPETVGETDPFLKMIRESDADEKQKIRGLAGLQVDMKQFINLSGNGTDV